MGPLNYISPGHWTLIVFLSQSKPLRPVLHPSITISQSTHLMTSRPLINRTCIKLVSLRPLSCLFSLLYLLPPHKHMVYWPRPAGLQTEPHTSELSSPRRPERLFFPLMSPTSVRIPHCLPTSLKPSKLESTPSTVAL